MSAETYGTFDGRRAKAVRQHDSGPVEGMWEVVFDGDSDVVTVPTLYSVVEIRSLRNLGD